MADKCGNCMFYFENKDGEDVCKRYPPKLIDADEGWSSEYPPVAKTDWCGEHSRQIGRKKDWQDEY